MPHTEAKPNPVQHWIQTHSDPLWLAKNCDLQIPFERACRAMLLAQHAEIERLRAVLQMSPLLNPSPAEQAGKATHAPIC